MSTLRAAFPRAVSCISFLIVFKGPQTQCWRAFAGTYSDVSAVSSDIFAVCRTFLRFYPQARAATYPHNVSGHWTNDVRIGTIGFRLMLSE
jgi:hypothetical protein